jgi:Calcineurin-like phosphoesterase
MPTHNRDHVITDITVTTCSTLSLLNSCTLDPEKWVRIDKDLYLGRNWLRRGYIHVQRKKENTLTAEDKVVVDIKIGRLDPGAVGKRKTQRDGKWESRDAGIWLKRSGKPHASDSVEAITAVDVLFGADALEPRPGWSIAQGTSLLLPGADQTEEVKLTVRKGPPVKVDPPVPRVSKAGKFKIMQVADLHLSTGLGVCRDPVPDGFHGGKCDADPRTMEFVGKMLDQEKPDLVVLTGDQINGETAPDAQTV